jgi:hypothetical protein
MIAALELSDELGREKTSQHENELNRSDASQSNGSQPVHFSSSSGKHGSKRYKNYQHTNIVTNKKNL